ncbi:hypothetical protein BISA_2224 [Bifidobacterium saguini DSM 23967]|uniref:Uncharacterized protein n=1 Tax=Bifidobacterium saguini DSM 23967 TaxID=1437607 RepID=A0A087D5Q2_9BIFI|nr:hypothetical protein BISA_2224 [Bifidobacterium saguini DSM 23967]
MRLHEMESSPSAKRSAAATGNHQRPKALHGYGDGHVNGYDDGYGNGHIYGYTDGYGDGHIYGHIYGYAHATAHKSFGSKLDGLYVQTCFQPFAPVRRESNDPSAEGQ